MIAYRNITILPASGCRRSQKVMEYLQKRNIPFRRIDLGSSEGQALAARYDLRASPGILVDGASLNPFDLLVQPECRVDEAKARAAFVDFDPDQAQ